VAEAASALARQGRAGVAGTPMILGLSFSHNATACLLDGQGQAVFCASEERFTRRKNDWGIPHLVLDELLAHHVRPGQVQAVAVGEGCMAAYGSRKFADFLYLGNLASRDRTLRSPLRTAALLAREVCGRTFRPRHEYQRLVTDALKKRGIIAPVRFFDHHTAHAASAFHCSPFEDALVVTLDGEGDGLSGSVWHASGPRLELVQKLDEIRSLGKFYRSITALLGLTVNRHEGKVTGLAAYGDADRYRETMRGLLHPEPDAEGLLTVRSRIAEHHMKRFNLRRVRLGGLAAHLGMYWRSRSWEGLLNRMIAAQARSIFAGALEGDPASLSFEEKADIAAAAQAVLEEVVVEYMGFHLERAPSRKVALAGGVFANVKLNQRVLERTEAEAIYIHPGMGDEGLAMGAAKLTYHETPGAKRSVLRSVHLGPAYREADIERACDHHQMRYTRLADEALAERIADALVNEEIVGLFRGRMEYGPRALGHRTILVNPAKREINDVVNKRLGRSEYMPFAPVVLDDAYEEIFEGPKLGGARFTTAFMTITLDVKPAWAKRIEGVVHVDGTARPQVIERDDDPFYYAILSKFRERTGIGCVVNTSFNLHEEPIVNRPEDAIRSFQSGAIDRLVMENLWVEPRDRAPLREPAGAVEVIRQAPVGQPTPR